jgi:HK97 family phage portal protein
MKIATVFRCVDILSGSIASLLLQPMRLTNAGTNEVTGERVGYFKVDQQNDLYPLLTLQANSRLTSFDLMKNLVSLVLLQGNAYVLPMYAEGGISELILLSPHSVQYDKNSNLYYVTDTVNGIYDRFTSDEIIHVKNVSVDGGYTGVSTIQYAANVLNIGAATDKKQEELFQPGSTLSGYMSGDEDLTRGFGPVQEKQLQTVSDRVASEISSGKKIFQVPGSMKFNPLTLSPEDLQLLESKSFNVYEICRFFGVHPDKVFSQSTTNYKASENTQTAFMSDTLRPMLRKIENEFTVKLIPRKLYSKYLIRFNLEDYYQVDSNTKSNYMTKTIQAGVYTVNEWRCKEGKMPVPGGDVAFISCNVAPVDSPKIKGETTQPADPPADPNNA